MSVFKATVRLLASLFVAFYGAVQLSMTVCGRTPRPTLIEWVCHTHSIVSPLLTFVLLLALALFVLSRRCINLRLPLAILFLLSYGIYGVVDATGYGLWWRALVPVIALAAAVGVGLRARWGTLLTYAVSALYALVWSWAAIAAARAGYFGSQPSLKGALSLVPGVAFALLFGFCCYAASGTRPGNGGAALGSVKSPEIQPCS